MDEQTLREEIERCRKQMIELSKDHSLTSSSMLQVSVKLDSLLNMYSKTRNSSAFYA